VPVAEVPAGDAPAKDGAVVLLGVHDKARVLLGEEVAIFRHAAVAAGQLHGAVAQLDELLDRRLLAGLRAAQPRLVGVHLRIAAEVIEAGVALARPPCRLGVDLIEIGDYRLHRRVEAIQVQPLGADLGRSRRQRVVPFSQPRDELDYIGIAPHPARKAAKVGQRLLRAGVVARATDEQVDAVCIGPLGLGRYGTGSALGDHPLRDLRTLPVELVRSVRRLAETHEARRAAVPPSGRIRSAIAIVASEVTPEPFGREPRHLVERTRLLEEVRRARDDDEPLLRVQAA
jgi:hypothetical protein